MHAQSFGVPVEAGGAIIVHVFAARIVNCAHISQRKIAAVIFAANDHRFPLAKTMEA